MRARFFRIIFFVLTVVAIGATLLHGFFLRQERLAQIDSQVREAAASLLDSDLNRLRVEGVERIEAILNEELGESRIGKVFVMRNDRGDRLYESAGAKVLQLGEVPGDPQWITLELKGRYVRILNLKLPRVPDRTLQVGLVIDQALLSTIYLSPSNLVFMLCIFLLGLAAAWGLTSTLMHPLSRLVDHISSVAESDNVSLAPLPRHLYSRGDIFNKRDELVRLIESFSELLERINRKQKLLRSWSYQMAHELKTPLAIMEGEIVAAKREGRLGQDTAGRVLGELMEASGTVTAFLSWAELEGAPPRKNLYAHSAQKTLADLGRRLEPRYPGRLRIQPDEDFSVLSGLQHLEHVALNLIQNALNYSEGAVTVNSPEAYTLQIVDQGAGVPQDVLARLGEPFNRGASPSGQQRGHGLGLAFVQSVCRLYDWKLTVSSTAAGTVVTLRFPRLQDEAAPPAVPGGASLHGAH